MRKSIVILGSLLAACTGCYAQTPRIDVLFRPDLQYPTLPQGCRFAVHDWPAVAADGSAYVKGAVIPPPPLWERECIARLTSAGPAIVTQIGDPVHGTGDTLAGIYQIQPQSAEEVGFRGLVQPTVGESLGALLWVDRDGLRPLVHPKLPLPGVPVEWQHVGWWAFGGRNVAFSVTVGWRHSAVYAGPVDDVRQIARVGQEAPGLPGRSIELIGWHSPRLSSGGEFPLFAVLDDDSEALWLGSANGLQLVANTWTGGPPTSLQFSDIHYGLVTPNGSLYFHADLIGPGLPQEGVDGVWRYHNGELTNVFMSNTPAPGLPGHTILALEHTEGFAVAGENRLLLIADTSSGRVAYEGYPGQLRLVAQEGRAAPGLPPDHLIAAFPNWSNLRTSSMRLTPRGEVIMAVWLAGDPINSSNDLALLLSSPDRAHRVLLRSGAPAFFGPQPVTIDSFGVSFGPEAEDHRRVLVSAWRSNLWVRGWVTVPPCGYSNCDGSTSEPTLNIADFLCFMQRFAAGDEYADCDQSVAPQHTAADFVCFMDRFMAGCAGPR